MSEPTNLAKLRHSNRMLDKFLYFINPLNWLTGFYHASVKNTANVSTLSYIEKKTDHLTDNLNLPGRIFRTFFHLDLISHISPYVMWTSFASGLFDQAFNYDLKDWKSKYPMTIFFAALLILFTISITLPLSLVIAAIVTTCIVGIYSFKTFIEAVNLKSSLDETKKDLETVKDKYVEDPCATIEKLIGLIKQHSKLELICNGIDSIENESLNDAEKAIKSYKANAEKLKKKINSSFDAADIKEYLEAQRKLLKQLDKTYQHVESIARKIKISKLSFIISNTLTKSGASYDSNRFTFMEMEIDIVHEHNNLTKLANRIGWERIKAVSDKILNPDEYKIELQKKIKTLNKPELLKLLSMIFDKNRVQTEKDIILSHINKVLENEPYIFKMILTLSDYYSMTDVEIQAIAIIRSNITTLIDQQKTDVSEGLSLDQIIQLKTVLRDSLYKEDSILNLLPTNKATEQLSNQINLYENKLSELEKAAEKVTDNPTSIIYKGHLKNLITDEPSSREKIENTQSDYNEKLKFGIFRKLSMSGAIIGLIGAVTFNPVLFTIGGVFLVSASSWLVGGVLVPRIIKKMSDSFEQQREERAEHLEKRDPESRMKKLLNSYQTFNTNIMLKQLSNGQPIILNSQTRQDTYDKFITKITEIYSTNNLDKISVKQFSTLQEKAENLKMGADKNNENASEFEKKLHAMWREQIYNEFNIKVRVYHNSNKSSLNILNSMLYKTKKLKQDANNNNEEPTVFADKLSIEWNNYYKKLLKTESSLSYLQNKILSPVDQSTDRVFEERQNFIKKYKIA